MSDNVHYIGASGSEGAVVSPKDPNENLVSFLEDILADAKAGELQGIACSLMSDDLIAGFAVVGFVGGFSMQGAAQCVVHELSCINVGAATGDDG